MFANTGNSAGYTASFTESLAKTTSTALGCGVYPRTLADQLQGIRSPKLAWDKGEQIHSVPDAMGTALRRYLDDEIDRAYPQQQNFTEVDEEDDSSEESVPEADKEAEVINSDAHTDGGVGMQGEDSMTDDQQALIEAGENPECPSCGSLSLYYSKGCKSCDSCCWSEC